MTGIAPQVSGLRRPGAAQARPMPIPIGQVGDLVAIAARAPSVHNTQPWRFLADGNALELYADRTRCLRRADPVGREMLISCGAALFGLRLAVRQFGYLPVTEVLVPEARGDLLACIGLGAQVPTSPHERAMLAAMSHRHTHRGPFTADPVPPGLLPALQHDAAAEGATLVLVGGSRYQQLAQLVAMGDLLQRQRPVLRAEVRRWTRPAGSPARDGVPARAHSASPRRQPGRLAMRDFDLGRGWGQLNSGGYAPAVTAVLTTSGDGPADWLRAGQALHRLLVHAASQWVFASLHTQPLESSSLRAQVRARLGLQGAPQMVLQLGRADIAPVTPRRPAGELFITP
jgi:hypothetical protein